MRVSEAAKRQQALKAHIDSEARKAGVYLDTFDGDFILGAIQEWLGERDLALTGSGVRTIRSVR